MKFAKLFEYDNHQLLITKTFGDDDQPEIECKTEIKGLQISNTLGFQDINKMEAAFQSMTSDSCKCIFEMLHDLSEGKTPWKK